MMKKKDKTLTTRFDAQTMAEFSVAADLLGFRSINALVHQLVYQKINEAKQTTNAEEFAALDVEVDRAERVDLGARRRLKNAGDAGQPGMNVISCRLCHSLPCRSLGK